MDLCTVHTSYAPHATPLHAACLLPNTHTAQPHFTIACYAILRCLRAFRFCLQGSPDISMRTALTTHTGCDTARIICATHGTRSPHYTGTSLLAHTVHLCHMPPPTFSPSPRAAHACTATLLRTVYRGRNHRQPAVDLPLLPFILPLSPSHTPPFAGCDTAGLHAWRAARRRLFGCRAVRRWRAEDRLV